MRGYTLTHPATGKESMIGTSQASGFTAFARWIEQYGLPADGVLKLTYYWDADGRQGIVKQMERGVVYANAGGIYGYDGSGCPSDHAVGGRLALQWAQDVLDTYAASRAAQIRFDQTTKNGDES